MKRIYQIILPILVVLAVSCNKKTEEVTLSSVAQLKTFTFAAQDTFPGLAAAKFTILELKDTGYVYNEDSILFGTKLDKVVPKFTFNATPSSAILYMPDSSGTKMDTIILTGKDTLNFNRQPAILTICSQDRSSYKTYRIEAFVHQVDPDLYEWTQLCASSISGEYESKTLSLGDKFVFISNNGLVNRVFFTEDGTEWKNGSAPTGLPEGCNVRQIISDGKTLYYAQGSTIYTSEDAINWQSTDCGLAGYTIPTMLLFFNNKVWAVAQEDATDQLWLAEVTDGVATLTDIQLSDDFPIGGFASATFPSPSGRAHALILGGYSTEGASLNSRWSFEYSKVEDQYRIKNFTIDNPTFNSLTGATMVWYADQLFLFGGIDAEAQFKDQPILTSHDEGMNWTIPDSTHCALPKEYSVRQKQTAIVRENAIYLFGGQSRTQTFSDVYKGRMNSIDW